MGVVEGIGAPFLVYLLRIFKPYWWLVRFEERLVEEFSFCVFDGFLNSEGMVVNSNGGPGIPFILAENLVSECGCLVSCPVPLVL